MESPIPRRLSTSISIPSSRVHEIENVINSYEAEEERIVNVLSRKLEKVCGPLPACLAQGGLIRSQTLATGREDSTGEHP
jgi:hypothetical protein